MVYGESYQTKQANKFRNRQNNHWRFRIELGQRLVKTLQDKRLSAKDPADINICDVGCSIGTFAIEFAKNGYKTFGIDMDEEALKIARELAIEEGVDPAFYCGDIAAWESFGPPIDIALCFDIFEHLHDDQLGAFLCSIREALSDSGGLIFHTFPTQYDYLFFDKKSSIRHLPLLPFRNIKNSRFERILRFYATMLDGASLIKTGLTHKMSIKKDSHCNPTTKDRLEEVLTRAGFTILEIGSTQLYPIMEKRCAQFGQQPISHRNLYGIAVPS
ncbi:MAG: methyltransferase domain-containing protein [Magnetococcales bacterium]|nr:methyltransferase domain-containing protein [Magnetococcales bacterium]